MKIYILFGKAGSGKNFVGDYLQNHYHWLHFDADQILTEEMKEYICLEKQMPAELIDEYMRILKIKISFFYETVTVPVVISQAMYRNKNRLALLTEFPNLQFVWVTAEDEVCYQRIKRRHNHVTVNYAQKISVLFEPPVGFNYLRIENNNPELKLPPIFEQ